MYPGCQNQMSQIFGFLLFFGSGTQGSKNADLAEICVRLADIFHISVRLTITDCCRIVTVTVMAEETARLMDIGAKKAKTSDTGTPFNGLDILSLQFSKSV